MAALVATKKHLWLTPSQINDKDRVFLLDALISPSDLSSNAVNTVVDRFQEAKKQAAAFQQFLPRRSHGADRRDQPQPCTNSSHREVQKRSVATCTPPQKERRGGHSRLKSSMEIMSLRTVIFNKKASAKRSRHRVSGHLRAGPSGKEWFTPQHTVPISPQCPQEIVPLTLPPPVLQSTAVSSECISASARKCSGPERSLEQLDRLSPAGPLLQGTELAALNIPVASLERLVPLVHHLAALKLLPNVSH